MKFRHLTTLGVALLGTGVEPIMGTKFLSPASLAGKAFNTPAMEFSPQNFSVNATLVKFNEEWCENSCQGPSESELSKPARDVPYALFFQDLFSASCFNCGYGKLVLWAADTGASALLWADLEVAGQDVRLIHNFGDAAKAADTKLPLMFLDKDDATYIRQALNESGTDPIAILEPGENPWVDMWDNGSWISVQVVASLAALFVSMEALRKLLIFLIKGKKATGAAAATNNGACGGKLSFPVLCLFIEFLANAIRFVNIAVDPLYSRGIFPYAWARFMLTVSVPLSWITTILLFLFWQDMVKMSKNLVSSMKQRRKGGALFLSRQSKILFIVSGFTVFSIDMAFTIAMAFFGMIQLLMINGAIFSVVNLIMAALFIVNGRYIGHFLKGSGGAVSLRKSTADDSSIDSTKGEEQTRTRAASSLSSFSSTAGSSFARFKRKGRSPRSRQQNEEKKKARQTNKKILEMTRNMMAAAICMIILVPVVAMAGIYSIMYHPIARLWLWLFIWLSFMAVSYFKVRAFVPPEKTLLPVEFWNKVLCRGDAFKADIDLEDAAYTSIAQPESSLSSPTKLRGTKPDQDDIPRGEFQSRPYASTSVSIYSDVSTHESFAQGDDGKWQSASSLANQRFATKPVGPATTLQTASDRVINACKTVGSNVRRSFAPSVKYSSSPTPEKPKVPKRRDLTGGRNLAFGEGSTWYRRKNKDALTIVTSPSPKSDQFL